MNLLAARITLRPRPLSDVLDLALPFCVANRRPLGKLVLATLVPVAALAAFLRFYAGWSWLGIWCTIAWPAYLAEGAFTVAFGELLFRAPEETRTRTLLGRWLRRLWPYIITRVLRLGMLVGAALVTLALPFAGPPFLFVPEAVLLEGGSIGQAFGRSRALARHRGLPCFGLWLAVAFAPVLGAVVADVLGNAALSKVLQLGRPFGDLWEDGGSGLALAGALLGIPIGAAARFLGYADLRTRKEGWDIQLKFMAITAEAEGQRRRVA
jgi:hypothetical protein